MTEKRYIYADIGIGYGYEILDSWFGYTGDDEPTEREIEEYDYLVIGLASNQDAAEGICRRLNDQQEEIEQLKRQIKDLRIDVLDSIHEAYHIKCNCSPCVMEECVKKVIE